MEEKQIMENKLISIIMPAYNEEKYISEAIESIMRQTYQDWELVIVDDASEDRTVDIIKQYSLSDPRIKLYRFSCNKGACAALNEALTKTEGEYICWLSADDKYKEEMLESSLDYLIRKPEMQAVFSVHEFINEKSISIEVWKPNEEYLHIGEKECVEPYATMLFAGNAFNACTVMASREASRKAGKFNVRHPYAGDYDYMLRLVAYSDIGFLNQVNVQSRIHPEQVSKEGCNDLDAIHVYEEMLYKDAIRKKIFQKSGIQDGREAILYTFKNRIEIYRQLKREREIMELESVMEKFLKEFPKIKEADNYCEQIAEKINLQKWDEAQKLLQMIPDTISAFVHSEKWGILVASILEYYGEFRKEEEVLKALLEYNKKNHEIYYMLGMIHEREGKRIDALDYYVMSLKTCEENQEDYKILVENFKRFVNENL